MLKRDKKGSEIEIIDKTTGEILVATLDSMLLSQDHGRIRAMMALTFKAESHPTLLKWIETLKSGGRGGDR